MSRYLRLSAGRACLRLHRRSLAVGTALALTVLAVGTVALTLGDYGLSVMQSFERLLGDGGVRDDYLGVYFVQDVRLPRAVGSMLVGAALGLSGRLFQTVSGNPLGSPDVVGFSTGAATGAVTAIIVLGASPAVTALGAVAGGVAAGAVIFLLAGGAGGSGMRLVLVGIGVSAVLRAVNALLLVRAPLEVAQSAEQWSAGSLNGTTWPYVAVLAAVVAASTVFLVPVARGLALLGLGDDASTALGAGAASVRSRAVGVGLLLVCVATAVAGPVAFVALAAPHIAQRLTHGPGAGLTTSALMGAMLVLVCDVISQRVIAPAEIAVGVLTGTLGGLYLLVLLWQEYRRNRL